jgi:hypothetical protein
VGHRACSTGLVVGEATRSLTPKTLHSTSSLSGAPQVRLSLLRSLRRPHGPHRSGASTCGHGSGRAGGASGARETNCRHAGEKRDTRGLPVPRRIPTAPVHSSSQ